MIIVEALQEYDGIGPCVFLAGSVSDERNWQAEVIDLLRATSATVVNPRRRDFPIGDAREVELQIAWEHRYLKRADLIACWFCPPTPCPIALLELGASCESGVPLVVGIDPSFALRLDVATQVRLRRPDVRLHDDLGGLACAIAEHFS